MGSLLVAVVCDEEVAAAAVAAGDLAVAVQVLDHHHLYLT